METIRPKLILLPTDFSPTAAHALRYAAALGGRFGAHLLVIYADTFVPPVDYTISAAGVFDLPREELIDVAREELQTFVETNVGTAIPYDVRVVVGTPINAILGQVSESGANLIVMGTHGRTGLRRLLFGSVTEAVMRLATVPVIAVNESAPETPEIEVILRSDRSTPESRAAIGYAGVLADRARFVDIAETDDPIERARREGADMIALGVTDERSLADALRGTAVERIVQHSLCPVLTVNHFAASRARREKRSYELASPA